VVTKIEALLLEARDIHFDLSSGIELVENAPVFSKRVVHVADVLVHIAVQYIIICAAALIRTELLVRSAMKRCATFNTFFLRHGMKLNRRADGIKKMREEKHDQLSDCKRL
jgi:hypothetical protein